jgi:nucleoside-diphosphate-sugar epimerase
MQSRTKTNSVLILGCGYTGQRVARRLLNEGVAVIATSRDPGSPRMRQLIKAGAEALPFDVTDPATFAPLQSQIRHGAIVLHSLPVVAAADSTAEAAQPGDRWDPTPKILELLGDRPSRLVYLSTTGVYGNIREVDETTPPAPATVRQKLRLAAEQAVAAGPWPSLILRPAAIYGPGRGVHVRLREGRFKLLGDGSNFVSRIHVDDLASIVAAALFSDVTGAYPVADDEPCPSREIVAFCAGLLGLPLPSSAGPDELDETRRSDRRVDGRAIRRLLKVDLAYASYREGIPASTLKEARVAAGDPSPIRKGGIHN